MQRAGGAALTLLKYQGVHDVIPYVSGSLAAGACLAIEGEAGSLLYLCSKHVVHCHSKAISLCGKWNDGLHHGLVLYAAKRQHLYNIRSYVGALLPDKHQTVLHTISRALFNVNASSAGMHCAAAV